MHMGSQTQSELAVVDFTDENMKPGTDAWLSACGVVRTALEHHGCFIALFDKLRPGLCDSVRSAIDELFGLPLETKMKETSDKLFHSYFGQVSWLPLYESLAIDNPMTEDGCQKFTNIMWPAQGNDPFCEIMNEYAKVVGELDHMVKTMVLESYGLDKHGCDGFLESNDYLLRFLKYRKPEMDEKDLGMHSHSDLTLISILHQLNFSGLEIKPKDGDYWIGVDASLSSFVVMAGDALKVWSNGRIESCEHRVTMNAEKTRYSTGLFSFAGKTLKVPEKLVDEQHPLRYKPLFDHYEYLRFFDRNKIKESDSRITAYCGVAGLH